MIVSDDCRLETEYLELLNQFIELEDVQSLHALDRIRANLHRKLMMSRNYAYQEEDEEFYRRSKVLMSNLDVLLGFNPPQRVGTKAQELHRFLNSEAFQAFLEGKTDVIETAYGKVRA
jgi:ElaB/YqjD/DUF883 family membrane-anchored ribosome-binding protein